MRYVWRRLTGRCTKCGQLLNGHQTASQRVVDLNARAGRITEILGRLPRAQNCGRCNHIVFEGEQGFVQRYLLVDIV
ncbi:MAG: hypothetical protein ABSG97_08425 [Sedimentisphaerales bacterium]